MEGPQKWLARTMAEKIAYSQATLDTAMVAGVGGWQGEGKQAHEQTGDQESKGGNEV